MLNRYLTFLAITTFTFCAAQSKKEILLDENDMPITVQQFKQKIAAPEYKFTIAFFENDTVLIAKAVLRKEEGQFSPDVRTEILTELRKITGKEIQIDKPIVINYFYEEVTTNSSQMIEHYTTDKNYKKFFNKHPEYLQFFIAQNNVKFKGDNIYRDTDSKLRKLLFPYAIAANYIIIWPDGKYYKQLSEYRQDEIPGKVKAGAKAK